MFQFRRIALLLVLVALLGNGCRTSRQVGYDVSVMVPGTRTRATLPDPSVLQPEVLRFTDTFISQTSAALDAYASQASTPEARIHALTWKLTLDSTAVAIATGSNPTTSLLDLVALTTITRISVEDQARRIAPPGSMDPWLNASRLLETNAWTLAGRFLTADQLNDLHSAITQWYQANGTTSAAFFARPQELLSLVHVAGERQNQNRPWSIFRLTALDPMAGLDPAVREVTRTRLFAERALYAMGRMPFFVRWQIELLSHQVLQQQQVTDALQSADRLSRAAESVSQTAALLPNQIADERKAIVSTFVQQESRLRGLSESVNQTLATADKMSTSMNTTIITFDALMKRFGVGEPSTTPPDTNSPPFNILDYAHTADRITLMASQVDMLIRDTAKTMDSAALDRRMADLREQTRADAKSVLDRAFLLAAGLILLIFVCAVVYRRLGR